MPLVISPPRVQDENRKYSPQNEPRYNQDHICAFRVLRGAKRQDENAENGPDNLVEPNAAEPLKRSDHRN